MGRGHKHGDLIERITNLERAVKKLDEYKTAIHYGEWYTWVDRKSVPIDWVIEGILSHLNLEIKHTESKTEIIEID